MSWAAVYGNLVAWNALKSEMFSGWMTGLLFLPSLFILSYFASHEALHHPKCTVVPTLITDFVYYDIMITLFASP